MDLKFESNLAELYRSNSQRIRVLSEAWIRQWAYCPNCGTGGLRKYANNAPVADFCCAGCHEDFELKSQSRMLARKLVDGAYGAMMQRLNSSTNPSLILLSYDKLALSVCNLVIIPKHYFISSMIQARKPLGSICAQSRVAGVQHSPGRSAFIGKDSCCREQGRSTED